MQGSIFNHMMLGSKENEMETKPEILLRVEICVIFLLLQVICDMKNYFENVCDELKSYFKILSPEIPEFLEEYIDGNIEVIYYYKSIASKVTIHHLLDPEEAGGNIIHVAKDDEVTGIIGDTYKSYPIAKAEGEDEPGDPPTKYILVNHLKIILIIII